jgi:hypothetical protein
MVRPARGLFAVVLCAAVGVLVGALGIPHAAAGEVTGLLRIAHLSPDTPAVDVALAPLPAADGAPLTEAGPDIATGLGYGDVSAFAEVRPGSYAVSLRAAGTGHGTPPVLTVRIDVPPGGARTVAVIGLFADLGLESLPDDLSAPPAGSARVRVLSAAAGIRSVDVGLEGGPALATALPFGGTGSPVVVPAGPSIVQVDGAPGSATALPVAWAPGSITTLLVLDAPGGGLTVRVVLDAAGPAVAPTGAVEAGAGGSAGPPAALPWTLGTAMAMAAVSRRGRVLAVVATAVLAAAPGAAFGAAAVPAQDPPVRVTLAAENDRPAAAPVRLQVPSVGVDTALTSIDLDTAGALVPPSDNTLAGWYGAGPAPGDPGPAVLTGHVDGVGGPAVFFRLRDVAVGDPVLVGRADGTTVRFTVTRVVRYAKGAFPTAEVYGPTPDPQLRLITCGGVFDRAAGSYRDNVVIFAR